MKAQRRRVDQRAVARELFASFFFGPPLAFGHQLFGDPPTTIRLADADPFKVSDGACVAPFHIIAAQTAQSDADEMKKKPPLLRQAKEVFMVGDYGFEPQTLCV